ncbi:MAG TPA: exosortase K [Pyrinomonadaceae bacterium]|nr:exosortase K [Pyrinomonadaceae bacterium]
MKYTRYNQLAKLLAILFISLGMKTFYSNASVNELRWVLAPTTFLVEIVTGRTFNFEMHAGYMSSDRSFLIATSCAGVNFMITAFLMLSIAKLWRGQLTWKRIPLVLVISYAATIAANTVRISTALHLQSDRWNATGLSANQLHRLEGIVIYFGFLLLLFLLLERTQNQTIGAGRTTGGLVRISQFILPLVIYYATTLGLPLANAVYRGEFAAKAFLEHSAFVLLIPLLLILPIALIRQRESDPRNTRNFV